MTDHDRQEDPAASSEGNPKRRQSVKHGTMADPFQEAVADKTNLEDFEGPGDNSEERKQKDQTFFMPLIVAFAVVAVLGVIVFVVVDEPSNPKGPGASQTRNAETGTSMAEIIENSTLAELDEKSLARARGFMESENLEQATKHSLAVQHGDAGENPGKGLARCHQMPRLSSKPGPGPPGRARANSSGLGPRSGRPGDHRTRACLVVRLRMGRFTG